MRIGILGGGNVGGRLSALLEAAGHDVMIGRRTGDVTFKDAVEHGDVVILAVHYAVAAELLAGLGSDLEGKILVDATNPLNDDWSPLLLGESTSGAQELSKAAPGAKIVKAFNTIFADVMTPDRQDRDGQRTTAFVASDDAAALLAVAQLAGDMGFAPVKIGTLRAARYLETMAHLNIELALGQGGGTNAAFLYHRV